MPENTFPNTEPPPHPESNKKEDGFKLPEDQMSPEAKVLQGKQNLEDEVFDTKSNVSDFTNPPQGEYISQELKNVPPANSSSQSKAGIPKITKFNFPKKAILIVFGILLVVTIVLIAFKLRSERVGPLVGTKGEIVWWGITLDEDVVAPLIRKFEEENPNLRVKYIKQSPTDYRERLTNALASGSGPDIFEMHNSWTPMFTSNLSLMPSSVMSAEEYSTTFYPVVTSSLTTAKGIVGIPLEYDALTLFINEDIFTSAVVKAPNTWDEFRSLATRLTQKDEKKIILQAGAAIGTIENLDYWQEIIALMMIQNGVNLAKPEGIEAEDAFKFYIQFSNEDEVWDDTMPPSTYAFATNKLAMFFATSKAASKIRDINPNLRYKTIPLPQLAKENPSDPDISYASFWVQSVWNRSSNNQSAWNLLKYLSSPESLQEMNSIRRSKNIFEKAYPRPDMAILQKNDSILGSIVSMGNSTKFWYLASDTNDGETGLNSQISRIYRDAILIAKERGNKYTDAVESLVGLNDVLSKYGIK